MTYEILSKTFESIFKSDEIKSTDKTRIVWHSGEPLTVPKEFYNEANRIINEYKPSHLQTSQFIITNGILVDDEWCKIFKNNNIEIVVSIDGPDFIHNSQRKQRNGKGSFDKVIGGINILKRNGIEFGVLTTITETTLNYPVELFQFYQQMGFENVGLNFEEVSAYNEESSLKNNLLPKIQTFISKLYELSKNDNSIKIREFEKMRNFILFGDMYEVEYDTLTPLSNITIDKNGNLSTFASELLGMNHERYENFIFGNILKDEVKQILKNPKLIELQHEIVNGVELCKKTCEYFEICGSAKIDAKLSANNSIPSKGRFDVTESFHCMVSIKILSNIIYTDMVSELSTAEIV